MQPKDRPTFPRAPRSPFRMFPGPRSHGISRTDVGTPVQCIQRGALKSRTGYEAGRRSRRVRFPGSDSKASAARTWPIIARDFTSIYCGRVPRTATMARVREISISCRLLGPRSTPQKRSLVSSRWPHTSLDHSLPPTLLVNFCRPLA